VPLLLVLFFAFACGHAASAPAGRRPNPNAPSRLSGSDNSMAAQISEETHALLRDEGNLLWARWTTGSGPLPASAVASHPRLSQRESIEIVIAAAGHASGDDARALRLLAQQLSTLALTREAGADIEALERARAQLAFAVPGNGQIMVGERDLDRLLIDEPNAQKRAALAQSEAKAALTLAPLAISRDAAVSKAIDALGLDSWAATEERAHGVSIADLAKLAEATLTATEAVGQRAVAAASLRNIGVTADRLRRSDLPRLARTTLADPQFTPGSAWANARTALEKIGAPSPSKGARPLALLVDPPTDVRLSLRPTGGFEEQRATLHEGARAVGATLIDVDRWELAQLGDGSAAEGVALLFESLAGQPEWLRATTQLRGEPLDDVVHTEAARRLLTVRRAAAMVLFEIRRRDGEQSAEAQSALYRGLLQRALYCILSDDDAGRWALEADVFASSVTPLLGGILAAQMERHFGSLWWSGERPALKEIWSKGRSLGALEAARVLGLAQLDPAVLAAVIDERMGYSAPDAPPPAPKPDYKYMQGDKKKRRKKKR
jgi:hypothetical protein